MNLYKFFLNQLFKLYQSKFEFTQTNFDYTAEEQFFRELRDMIDAVYPRDPS